MTQNPDSKSYSDIFSDATYTLPEILKSLTLETSRRSNASVNIDLNPEKLDPEIATWHVKYRFLYGVCYSLNLKPKVTMLQITEIVVQSYINVFVYLHHPGQFLDYNTVTKVGYFNIYFCMFSDFKGIMLKSPEIYLDIRLFTKSRQHN